MGLPNHRSPSGTGQTASASVVGSAPTERQFDSDDSDVELLLSGLDSRYYLI